MWRRACLAISVVLVTLAAAPLAARQGAATASGTFTVAGKPAKITHVYASSGPGFFDKSKTDTTVVLSDIELTPAQLDDQFALVELANSGKVHAIVLVIDADKQNHLVPDARRGVQDVRIDRRQQQQVRRLLIHEDADCGESLHGQARHVWPEGRAVPVLRHVRRAGPREVDRRGRLGAAGASNSVVM